MTRRLAFAVIGLAAIGCSDPRPRPDVVASVDETEPALLVVAPALSTPVGTGPEKEAPPALIAQRPVREVEAPLPRDVRVRVTPQGDASRVEVDQPAALVALRLGDVRAAGSGKASLTAPQGAEVIVELTERKGLTTTRAVVHVGEGRGGFTAHLAEPPVAVARDARKQHDCAAHEDGLGGYAVVCRVHAEATAASVTSENARAGVFQALVAPHAGYDSGVTIVRFDFAPPASDDAPWVEAKMLTYDSDASGVVIRAEVSRVAGEARPSFTLASAGRRQPFIPFRRGCMMPMRRDDPLL